MAHAFAAIDRGVALLHVCKSLLFFFASILVARNRSSLDRRWAAILQPHLLELGGSTVWCMSQFLVGS